jgi:hypothetical protein
MESGLCTNSGEKRVMEVNRSKEEWHQWKGAGKRRLNEASCSLSQDD